MDTACSKYLFITRRYDFENKHIYAYIYAWPSIKSAENLL